MSQDKLSRTIGLPGAAFLIIGYVVGATIFILPGSLAAEAGPAVYLAYLLAAIPAIFAGFAMAVVGSAMPASGSIYLFIRDLLSPSLGFIYLWLMVVMAAIVIPLVGIGFANYFEYFYPGLNNTVVVLSIITVFIGVNYVGMKLATGLQSLMVIGFMVVLLVFAFGGLANGDATLMKPLFPLGGSPVVLASITAYFSYMGVFIIAEVAGEIKRPGRTIPLAIFLSFAVIIIIYTLVPYALTSVLPWQTLGSTQMAVVTASEEFLPGWLVGIVAAGALLAAATSVNGIMMGMSRDFYKGAKSGLFPGYFSVIDKRFGTPARSVLVIGALALAGALVGGNIVQYAQIAVMGLMIVQILTGVAMLRLPSRLPEVYQASAFKMGLIPLRFVAICYITFSVVFMVILGMEHPDAALSGLVFIALGFSWFAISRRLESLGETANE